MLQAPDRPRRSAVPRRAGAALALLAGLAGCTPVSTVRTSDAAFTVDALRAGKAAVVSVVQVDETANVRPPFIDALERVLAATRRDLPLVPHARVASALDDSTSRFLLLGYQMHGSAEPVWLRRAAGSLRGLARYAIFGRVESVALRRVDRVDPTSNPDLRSSTGEVRVTGQDARVSLHVYDLENLALVFSGSYWGSSEVALSSGEATPPRYSEDETDVSTPYDTTVTGLFLKPPPLVRSLESAFVQFARTLPGGPPR
jgi:hypothetical protein